MLDRATTNPWLNTNRVKITLNAAATLSAGDVSVTGIALANYGLVTITGSGTSYTIQFAQPISCAFQSSNARKVRLAFTGDGNLIEPIAGVADLIGTSREKFKLCHVGRT